MENKRQITKQSSFSLQELYDKYAGMLLGYILEVVKDRNLAEQHLIAIYNALPMHINTWEADCNIWCQLQRLAKKQLAGFYTSARKDDSVINSDNSVNKFTGLMNDEQWHIFNSVYHYGKTISKLAEELNKTQEYVLKALKEAFFKIKKR